MIEKTYSWLHADERYARIGWGLLLAACAAFVVFVLWGHALAPRARASRYSPEAVQQCAFHEVTGLACPLCGLTRGCGEFLLGRWGRSVRLHPAAGLLCVAVGLLSVEAGRRVVATHPARPAGVGVKALYVALAALGVGLAATWVARLLG